MLRNMLKIIAIAFLMPPVIWGSGALFYKIWGLLFLDDEWAKIATILSVVIICLGSFYSWIFRDA